MMYGFESLVNKEVVHRQSNYGKLAHKQKIEAKRLNRNNCTFCHNWDYEKGDMVLNKEHAEIMREIFDWYVFRLQEVQEICDYLIDIGINKSIVTINKWLKETAFTGTFCIKKQEHCS